MAILEGGDLRLLHHSLRPEAGIIGKPVSLLSASPGPCGCFFKCPKANSPKLPKGMLSRFRSFQNPLRDHLPNVVVTAVRKVTANLFEHDF